MIVKETAAKIVERGIDFDAILKKARQTAYAPAGLLTLDDPTNASSFRVWLE